MEQKRADRHLIADDIGLSKRDSFVERFFTEGMAELERYLAKWAAYRDLAGDD
jgi:hypothetical protein